MTANPDNQVNPWATHASRLIYDNPWIRVNEHQVTNPSGAPGIYGEVHYKHLAIGIVPIDDNGWTWLVGQYRYPLKQFSWEIPEGGGLLNIPPIESAQRELLEETGLTATSWAEIGRLHLSNSVSDELAILFVATNLTEGIAQPEPTEQLQLWHLPLTEAFEMVHNGQITDSMSVVALQTLEILQLQGKGWFSTQIGFQ